MGRCYDDLNILYRLFETLTSHMRFIEVYPNVLSREHLHQTKYLVLRTSNKILLL